MPQPETLSAAEEAEHSSKFPLLEKLTRYVEVNEPQILIDELITRTSENPDVDMVLLRKSIEFMEEVHQNSFRKYNYEPKDIRKPFITHTLATALIAYDLMKDTSPKDSLTDSLAVALLHDAIEDGKLPRDKTLPLSKTNQRDVTRADLEERGFSKRIVDGVEALSNVRDIEVPSVGMVRKKLTHDEYDARIEEGMRKDPELGLEKIKISDRSTNLLDPFRRLKREHGLIYQFKHRNDEEPPPKDAFTSRKDHIVNTRRYLLSKVAGNPLVNGYIHNVLDLAEITCQIGFNPEKWQQQLKSRKFLARRKRQK